MKIVVGILVAAVAIAVGYRVVKGRNVWEDIFDSTGGLESQGGVGGGFSGGPAGKA